MDSSTLVSSAMNRTELKGSFFDASLLQMQPQVPTNFVWPKEYLVEAQEELQPTVIDLAGFISGNEEAIENAAKLISAACSGHGIFQVINHGVDSLLISEAYDHLDAFFKLPIDKKLRAHRAPGTFWGYSSAHAERFSSNLLWNETLSFPFHENDAEPVVTNYFTSTLGEHFEQTGMVFQKYCKAIKELGLKLMELLAIGLGVDRYHYRNLFEDGCSNMRCNYYPSSKEPNLVFGTGPHCDPNSLTILHQDEVGGLDVFVDNKWQTIRPCPEALVINIGDTFKALSNGRYKSCLHRARVNKCKERRSLAFFMNPKEDKVLTAPDDIVRRDGTKHYPDFTWSDMLEFTHHHYRTDGATLQNFINWLLSSKKQTF